MRCSRLSSFLFVVPMTYATQLPVWAHLRVMDRPQLQQIVHGELAQLRSARLRGSAVGIRKIASKEQEPDLDIMRMLPG